MGSSNQSLGDADCASRFNSTMMRHTIITHSRNGQKKLTREEIKALAQGMDHSVRIAEEIYNNDKEAKQVDHSQIIQDILELNDWEAELKEGVEEDIKKEIDEGSIELIDPKPVAAYDDKDFDSIEGKKEKEKRLERWKLSSVKMRPHWCKNFSRATLTQKFKIQMQKQQQVKSRRDIIAR